MNKTQILFFAISGIILGLAFFVLPGIIIPILIIFLVIWSILKFCPYKEKKFLIIIFVLGLAIRLILASPLFAVSYGTNVLAPDAKNINPGETVLSGDAAGYSAYAWFLSQYWKGDRSTFSDPSQVAYGKYFFTAHTYFLGYLYFLFGYVPFLGILLNCIIGSLAALMTYFLVKDSLGAKQAKIPSLLAAFWPSCILWSTTNTKEPVVVLSLLTIIWASLRIYHKFHIVHVLFLSLSFLLLFLYRPYLYMPLLLWLFLLLFIKITEIPSLNLPKVMFVAILIAALAFQFEPTKSLIVKGSQRAKSVLPTMIALNTGIYRTGGSAYTIYPEIFYSTHPSYMNEHLPEINPRSFSYAFAKGTTYFLLAPFPWTINSPLQLISFPEILAWYVILPFSLLGILIGLRYKLRNIVFIFLISALLTVMYALTDANIGTVFRHRSSLLPLYFIFASIAFDQLFSKKPTGSPK